MRVLHCCLAAFYIDDYGYQENVLPRMHKLQGHDVAIVASTQAYVDNRVLGHVEARSYSTADGIPITRLPYPRWIPRVLARRLRFYDGLQERLDSFAPDVLFLHDCQFLEMRTIVRYAKRHPEVRIYIDGHTDFINSARGWLSKNLLHRILYRYCAQIVEPYTRKFYGVLPVRVEFFQDMYGTPPEKTELLVLGADHTRVNLDRRDEIRSATRSRLSIDDDDFVVVAGGKIDRRKQFPELMHAISKINRPDVKLILFGTPTEEMEHEVERLSHHDSIRHVGWAQADQTYEYLLAADLGVFPGTHSVLWEQAVGVGLPCVFKRWDGIQHVDVGGNCLFLEEGTRGEIEQAILSLCGRGETYSRLKQVATTKGMTEFSYYEIARRAIEEP